MVGSDAVINSMMYLIESAGLHCLKHLANYRSMKLEPKIDAMSYL